MNLSTHYQNKPAVSAERDAAIRLYAGQIGSQAVQLVPNFLSGLLLILLANQAPASPLSPSPLLTAPEIAKILHISKAVALQ